nr:hypothetical protein [Tanacetum cinerariifolium]
MSTTPGSSDGDDSWDRP